MLGRFAKRLLVVAVVAPILFSAAIADARPITFLEIRFHKSQGKSHDEIVEIIKDRGLSFKIDATMKGRLGKLGFNDKHFEALRSLEKPGAKPEGPPPKGEKPDNQKPAKPDAAKPDDAPKPEIGPRFDAMFGRTEKQVERTMKQCGVDLQRNRTKHITLVAAKDTAAKFLPLISKLEGKLARRFPEPIASGVDRRAANIALLKTRPEYEYWVKTLFKVLREDGVMFQQVAEGDIESRMLKSSSFFLRGVYSVCLEEMSEERAGRGVAFAVGFQYMRQLSRYEAPDAIATGFGDLAEVMAFGSPTVMVTSGYTERELARGITPWTQIVRGLFAARKIASVQNVLAYNTESMEVAEYATAWSLVEALATNPDKLAKLTTELRNSAVAPWENLRQVYGQPDKPLEEQAFLKIWARFVASKL
ncbi:MAG: hypothetical protein VX988_06460 [Planctomycetota bacterium]|nr:hypothetical protein [Planctomycetota bacterium]